MEWIVMMRMHDTSTGGHKWTEWVEVERFKCRYLAEWEIIKSSEYATRQTREYKIVAQ